MHAANFFVPSFLKAVNECTEESFRSIMTEPSPGVFAFEMLQPHFCELLLAEVSSSFAIDIWQVNFSLSCSLAFMFSYQVLIA